MMNKIREWKKVVFSAEFGDEGMCPECGESDGECQCPGPNSETDDGHPFEFKETADYFMARPPKGYGWEGEKLED